MARGLFVGDYVGLAGAGRDFVAVYSASQPDDPADAFARYFGRRDAERKGRRDAKKERRGGRGRR